MKGVSRNAVYKAARDKELASVRLAGIIAINRDDATDCVLESRTGCGKGISTNEEAKASQRKRWRKRKEENPGVPHQMEKWKVGESDFQASKPGRSRALR